MAQLDDSVRSTIQFEDAPAEYANRPDIQDRINSFETSLNKGRDLSGPIRLTPRLALAGFAPERQTVPDAIRGI